MTDPTTRGALRWGILSTADIARKKVIPAMRKAARCEITAIASRDAGRAQAVAAELAIPVTHSSYDALLADPDVDAVYMPLPNHMHLEWTLAEAVARLNAEWDDDVAAYDRIHRDILHMADMLSIGIINQFPGRF